MKRIKIKANQYAELMADVSESGTFYVMLEDRLNYTLQGNLFVDLIKEAVNGGKYDNAGEMVAFCYRASCMAYDQLSSDEKLAILAPPQSAIARKVAKATKAVKSDD